MEEQYIIENKNFTTIIDKEGVTLKPKQEENKTIEDIKQKAINYLYEKFTDRKFITEDDVKLFEILYKD